MKAKIYRPVTSGPLFGKVVTTVTTEAEGHDEAVYHVCRARGLAIVHEKRNRNGTLTTYLERKAP